MPEPNPEKQVSPCHSVFKDSIYTFSHSFWGAAPRAAFVRYPLQNPQLGVFKTLNEDTYNAETGDRYEFSGAGFWKNELNETVCYYAVVRLSNDNDSSRRHLIGYNLNTKAELFRINYPYLGLDISVNHPPIVYKDKLILYAGKGLECRDLENGSLLWEYGAPSQIYGNYPEAVEGNFGYNYLPPIFNDGYLYTHPSYSGLCISIDVETGQERWKSKFGRSFATVASNLYEIGNKLIVVRDGSLFILGKLDGKILQELRPEMKNTSYRSCVVDPVNGLIFVDWTDGNICKMRCFKMK